MKVKNIQDLYTLQQFVKVSAVYRTYKSGYSPIALCAPNHVRCFGNILQYDFPYNVDSSECVYTLRFYYALNVWRMSIAILKERESYRHDKMWHIFWQENDTPFRSLQFGTARYALNVQEFWSMLEDVANSGVIKVCEGMFLNDKWDNCCFSDTMPRVEINTLFVIDAPDVNELEAKRRKQQINLYSYPFSKEPVSYSWDEIKDLFTELSPEEIALLQKQDIHKKLSAADKKLFDACRTLNLRGIKTALKNGARVNSLNNDGNSPISVCIEAINDGFINENVIWEEIISLVKQKEPTAKKIISYLLEQGADIDLFGYGGSHPLTQCYFSDSLGLMKFLLKKGANPNYNEYLTDLSDTDRQLDIVSCVLTWTWDYFDQEPERIALMQKMERLLLSYGAKAHPDD